MWAGGLRHTVSMMEGLWCWEGQRRPPWLGVSRGTGGTGVGRRPGMSRVCFERAARRCSSGWAGAARLTNNVELVKKRQIDQWNKIESP